jgi:RNA-directed DNA polymerase
MTKAPISLQDRRRRIARKATADRAHRFWGMDPHIATIETLAEASRISKANGGAPGRDGLTCEDIAADGRQRVLHDIRAALLQGTDEPSPPRRVESPTGNGQTSRLLIPCMRDRVVQGAVKILLEAIFEVDCCPNSSGYRPTRSPHQALAEVRRSLLRRMFKGIDVDLSACFDSIRHHLVLAKMARRVPDDQVLALVKKILNATGAVGVPHGGPVRPLAANIYRNDLDWQVEQLRQPTEDGPYDSLNAHRFADDLSILMRHYGSKQGMEPWVQEPLHQHLETLQVQGNADKTRVVNTLEGNAVSFLGFDVRRVLNRRQQPSMLLTPRKKARVASKAEVRKSVRERGAQPVPASIQRLNPVLAGWVRSFRVANANRAFGEVRDDVEMTVRTRLSRRQRRQKRSIGWKRWSHEDLYGVLGLYGDWPLQPLQHAAASR